MIYDTCEIIVSNSKMSNNFKDFEFELAKIFSIESDFEDDFKSFDAEEIFSKTYSKAYDHYNSKMISSAEKVFPVIKNVYENPSNNFQRIVVPFTDGKTLNVVSNLEDGYNSKGKTLVNDFEKIYH